MDREAEEAMRDDRLNRQKNNSPEIRSRRRRRNGGGGNAAWRDEGKVAGDKEVDGGENALMVDAEAAGGESTTVADAEADGGENALMADTKAAGGESTMVADTKAVGGENAMMADTEAAGGESTMVADMEVAGGENVETADTEVAEGENAETADTDKMGAGIENALPENGNAEDSAFELYSTANPTESDTGHEPVCEAETQDEAADDEALGVNTPGDETYDGDETPVGSPSSQLPADYRIPPRKWFLTFMYMNIPVIGWIYLLVKAFGRKNTQLKDFARAYLLYKLVFLLVALIILGLAVYVGLGILDELLAYMEML